MTTKHTTARKLTVASLQEQHFTTSCDALPSRLITARQTLQLIDEIPVAPDGTYGGGSSALALSDTKQQQQHASHTKTTTVLVIITTEACGC